MKGVILAGGTGSRLFPLTKVTNKHLLPVYNKPMIFYPIETLVKVGIKDILIILGGESVGDFIKLLGSGKDFGVNLSYRFQDEAGGIAQALSLAEEFVGTEKFMVILGDNVLEDDLFEAARDFLASNARAGIFLKEVPDPERFGVATVHDGKVIEIEEKPLEPKSNLAVTGVYMYDHTVFEIIRTLHPSGRGEYEISDVNNAYAADNSLKVYYLQSYWTDAGQFESLFKATCLARETTLKREE